MLNHFYKRITHYDMDHAAFITCMPMTHFYTMNRPCQDIKKLNQQTYRIKKMKFSRIHLKNYKQTHTLIELTTRYEKPYQNRTVTQKNAHYGTVSNRNIANNIEVRKPLLQRRF